MKSLDTNILLYATNADCDEHEPARRLVEQALKEPEEWIISDQIYFEYYRLLRNAAVLKKPLSAAAAFRQVDFFRRHTGWQHCCYDISFFSDVEKHLSERLFPARRTFDLMLAVTLRRHSVKELYTHNPKDFKPFAWFHVYDPIG